MVVNIYRVFSILTNKVLMSVLLCCLGCLLCGNGFLACCCPLPWLLVGFFFTSLLAVLVKVVFMACLYLLCRNYFISTNWLLGRSSCNCARLVSISSLVVWYLAPRSCRMRFVRSNLHLLVMEVHLFLNT